MSSEPLRKRDASDVEHPSQGALLAFIREQCAAHEKNRINEHLLTGCASCNRLYAELKQTSNTLNYLNSMPRYLFYPELQSNQLLLHAQRGVPLTSMWTGKRKRRFQVRQVAGRQQERGAGLRIFRLSFPVAFGLLLTFMTVAVVLAYTIASFVRLPFLLPGQSSNHIYPLQNQPTITRHQPTPTVTVAVTITPSPGVTVSPGPTLAPTIIEGAKLTVCSPSQYPDSIILICGHGFKGVNKVWLEVGYHGSNSLKTFGPYPVSSAGEFRVPVIISFSCRNSSVIVYAANKKQQPLTLPLMTGARSGCYLPTPNVPPVGRS